MLNMVKKKRIICEYAFHKTSKELIYEKSKNHDPWENGQFGNFDFRANMEDVGNYDKGSDVGKERVKWK
ncbi:hypothetical protein [Lentilactobacillus buchneri]|uniref:Uncharacterized protein n=1 Tax=Lentilactobacillus buchneri subsp. silagei CD034 TaxID=1071400 RepID=J9VY18_LENBU|nr:hypothetical protein [Lentilactobacillus buchneri]MCC6100653.1 hypothetical protein [Lactobacillus sp.]AFR99158.1 hypothetical protein LBUCD034_0045 [Lentilactobacillus buchneri subsp. silagei CD034]MCT2900597.1 hypothetical protein [Lentilactobacillus buchneri]MCT3542580.1 hypothetical protein [Lentilactobacillus buchneri]MCT3545703.1 hypothetical protein [Lentilactobacillus buchneri]